MSNDPDLRIPVRLIRVAESCRDDQNFRAVMRGATGIWAPAGIKLELVDTPVIQLPEDEGLFQAMLDLGGPDGRAAIMKYLRVLEDLVREHDDGRSVLVCAARYPVVQDVTSKAVVETKYNGYQFKGTNIVEIRDGPEAPVESHGHDEVVLAHEIGHVLGLCHVEEADRLMAQGTPGVALIQGEIDVARVAAASFLEPRPAR